MRGFTLIELIVCLAVLGILYGVAAFAALPRRTTAAEDASAIVHRLVTHAVNQQRPASAMVPLGRDSVMVRALPNGRVIGWPRSVPTASVER